MKHMIRSVVASILALAMLAGFLGLASAKVPTDIHLTYTWIDNFNGSPLNSRWSWINEDPTHWSLSAVPGFLRITTNTNITTNNILVQKAPLVGDYAIETRVLFTPTQNFQIAGLVVYLDDNNFLTLGRAFCGTAPPACVGNGIYFDHIENGTYIGSGFGMNTSAEGVAYLRIVRTANIYTGYVSMDGSDWILVGSHTAGITPTKIGIKATNQTSGAAEIPADFDYFSLVDHSIYVFLPIIIR
jgi:beta-xylosidase